jgi:hypothetical protein
MKYDSYKVVNRTVTYNKVKYTYIHYVIKQKGL